jgi:hypothetical protein
LATALDGDDDGDVGDGDGDVGAPRAARQDAPCSRADWAAACSIFADVGAPRPARQDAPGPAVLDTLARREAALEPDAGR